MDFTKIRVLLPGGGGRQTLSIIHMLKAAGCQVAVLCSSKKVLCYASRFPDEKILDARAEAAHPEFMDCVFDAVKTGKYDVLLPVGELATEHITEREDELKQYVRLACATRAAYSQAGNKQKTYEAAMKIGVPIARTRMDGESVEDFLAAAAFPVVVKPRHGMGSIGFHKFNTEAEFRAALAEGMFDPDESIIQEFIDHERRHGTYIMMDKNHTVKSVIATEVVRWYPVDAGTSTLSMSVDDPDVVRYSCELLKELGWNGYANVGFMIDKRDGKPKLLEINGRIPATIKLAWMCGINVGQQLVEMAMDEEVTYYPPNTKFGLMSRHFQADLMWFLKSPNRFRTKPSWFSWKNATDQVFFLNDPLPSLRYSLSAFGEYKSFKEKRKR